jgi:DNA repair exonuclease SbcCD nuclease subunit
MQNVLLFGDLHLTQKDIVECKQILDEIVQLVKTNNVDTLIDLGDTFDNLKPTSQELDLFASFIKEVNIPLIILVANSHESTTEEDSIVNHFGILSDKVTIVKEFKDDNYLYCGHFIVKEAKKNFGAKISKLTLKQYKFVFLGHQHSKEIIKPNICQLGSVRYVNFDEVEDTNKVVALITDYHKDEARVHFIPIFNANPMITIDLAQNRENKEQNETLNTKESKSQAQSSSKKTLSLDECQKTLNSLDSKTKVKIRIHDFESFKQFLSLVSRYTSKFSVFKYETEFEVISVNKQNCQLTETNTFKESFLKWLEAQEIDVQIKDILLKEIK